MRQSAKRFISSVVSLFLIVAASVLFFNFIRPAYREVSEMKGRLESMQEFRDEQAQAVRDIKALIGTYNSSEEIRETVALALPLAPALSEAVAQLNGLVVNNALSAQSYSVSAITEPVLTEEMRRQLARQDGGIVVQPVSPIVFNLRLAGSYEDFKKFLEQLETNVRVFDLRAITVQPAGKSNQNLFTYDLTVATYYQYHQ